MPPVAALNTSNSRDTLLRFLRAGIATTIIDGLFSSILSVAAYDSTVSRLFQGVAATLVGNSSFDGGARTTALGMLMHCCIAFLWSAIFIFGLMRLAWIQRVLSSRFGVLKVASVYGPAVWLVMSLIVIPLLVHRPPNISIRWWVQLIGHFPFVGVPIVGSASWAANRFDDEPKPSAA